MYITLNDEKIVLNFNPYPTLKISGPDPYYLIELREFKKNEDQSLFVEGFHLDKINNVFTIPIDFYYDFEIWNAFWE